MGCLLFSTLGHSLQLRSKRSPVTCTKVLKTMCTPRVKTQSSNNTEDSISAEVILLNYLNEKFTDATAEGLDYLNLHLMMEILVFAKGREIILYNACAAFPANSTPSHEHTTCMCIPYYSGEACAFVCNGYGSLYGQWKLRMPSWKNRRGMPNYADDFCKCAKEYMGTDWEVKRRQTMVVNAIKITQATTVKV
eukprot:TRINITY_DN70216_c0_g1_i1.p1 TRINITY_DN70216_c0_g1~~TRINITY_DN70216_c0_g1_i1.p1  ORF type:complete len:193 (+),score=14.86 TRINITY_DN70216_c0_g1_i1:98-676(+)